MRYEYMTVGRDVWRVDRETPEKYYETVVPTGHGGSGTAFIIGRVAERVASFVVASHAREYADRKNRETTNG